MKKREIFKIIALTLPFHTALADIISNPPIPKPLNKVNFQISAEEWVTTRTAKVIIAVDAALNEGQLSQVRGEIIEKLNKLVPNAEWHITTFDRSQDNSGLEKLRVEAETRVPENTLGNLRQQAKSLSKPGQAYTVYNIDYTPSLAEVQTTQAVLREKIYNSAKAELARLNTIYPDQKYYLNTIDFYYNQISPQPMVLERAMKTANFAAVSAGAPVIPVSNNVVLSANISLAANIHDNNNNVPAKP